MKKDSSILVLGSRGLVGSALKRNLEKQGYTNLLCPIRSDLNLLDGNKVEEYFEKNKPDYVFLAAAKVGGIHANNEYRADFIYENLLIQNNVLGSAWKHKVKKLLFLGSSCIYPRECPQPIKEEYLLTGELEQTNEPYAIAKIAGLKMAESFRRQYGCQFYSVMPTNLYGVNDNFHLENSHVIPGLIARMELAKKNGDKEFKVWGSGKPRREFLYVDDMAEACIFVMNIEGDHDNFFNIGTGEDIEIGELAKIIKEKVGFEGELKFDSSKPDGTMIKRLDVSRINKLGWKAKTTLDKGLDLAVDYYRNNY